MVMTRCSCRFVLVSGCKRCRCRSRRLLQRCSTLSWWIENRSLMRIELAPIHQAGSEYEEEGGYGWEYVSDQQGNGSGQQEAHAEPAVLVQPLSGEEAGSGEGAMLGSPVPLCEAGSVGPCARDAKGKSGEKCGSMYGKPCHHSGGGGGGGVVE